MLERARGCFRHGGRRLLRLPCDRTDHSKSRRLHSAFWTHGAGDIDLPAWWVALLSRSPPELSSAKQSIVETAKKCIARGLSDGGFLDFLYPAKTLSLIHKLAVRDAAYAKSRGQRQTTNASSRHFTSRTVDSQQLALESDEVHANRLIDEITEHDGENAVEEVYTRKGARMTGPLAGLRAAYRPLRRDFTEQMGDLLEMMNPLEDFRKVRYMIPMAEELERVGAALLEETVETVIEYLHWKKQESWQTRDWATMARILLLKGQENMLCDLYSQALECGEGIELTTNIMERLFDFRRVAWFDDYGLAFRLHEIYRQWAQIHSVTEAFWSLAKTLPFHKLRVLSQNLGHRVPDSYEGYACTTLDSRRRCTLELMDFLLGRAEYATMSNSAAGHFAEEFFKILEMAEAEQVLKYITVLLDLEGTTSRVVQNATYAFEAFRILQQRQFGMKPRLLERIFERLCQARRPDQAQLVLESILRQHPGQQRLYSQLLTLCAQVGQEKQFMKTWDYHVNVLGRKVHLSMCQRKLDLYRRRNDLGSVIDTFDEMQSKFGITPDVNCWNSVIATYCRAQDLYGAYEWLNRMEEAGIKPDTPSYLPILWLHAKMGDLTNVERLLNEHEDRKLPGSDSFLKALIYCLVKENHMRHALQIATVWVARKKYEISSTPSYIFNLFINQYAVRGDLLEIWRIRDIMRKLRIAEDATTYLATMTGLTIRGRTSDAWNALKDMTNGSDRGRGLTATPRHYAIIMNGFTKEGLFDMVFYVYESLHKVGLVPDWNVKTALLRAAALAESHEHRDSRTDQPLTLAKTEQLIDATLEEADRADMAAADIVSVASHESMDQVYSSAYFDYLIAIYGREGMFDHVDRVFAKYLDFATKRTGEENDAALRDFEMPLRMLTTLMNTYLKQGAHHGVERCWRLAWEASSKLATNSLDESSGNGALSTNPIFPSRAHILAQPLLPEIRSLAERGLLHSHATPLISRLLNRGFHLDNKCWNAYVRALLEDPQGNQTFAFEIAERYLMADWRGWPTSRQNRYGLIDIRRNDVLKARIAGFANSGRTTRNRPVDVDTKVDMLGPLTDVMGNYFPPQREGMRALRGGFIRYPEYETMVWLASAYMDVRSGESFSGMAEEKLEQIAKIAPKAVEALLTMPRIDDEVQNRLLKRA